MAADRIEVATLNLTVTGDTTDIEAKVNALAEKLKAPLANALNKATSTLNSSSFEKAKTNIENLQKDIQTNYNKIHKHNNYLANSFKSLAKRIVSIYGIIKAVKGIVSIVKSASDAYEAANLFYVSFGYTLDETDDGITDLTGKANAFAKALENAWGIPARQLRAAIGSFNLFTKSMGMTTQQAYTLSTQLTQITVEISSLRNISFEEALNKVKAGLAGNSRPLRDIGIAVNEANIAQIAYKYNLAQVGTELTTQQKILARYLAIWEAVTNTGDIGNFSRTIGSLETQMKLLQTRGQELKIVWGTALVPAAKQVIYFLNTMVNVLMVLGKSFQSFMAGISGMSLGQLDIEFQAAADAANAATGGTSDIADDLAEADESLKSMLAGFDKFNVLQDGATGLGFNINDFDLSQFQLEIPETVIAPQVEKWTDAILEFLGYTKTVTETVDELGNSIKEVSYAWGGWGKVSPVLKTIVEIVKIIISLKLASWITKLVPLIQGWALQMKLASTQAISLSKALQALSGVFLVALIYGIMALIQNWDKLNNVEKVVYTSIVALIGVLYLYSSGMGLAILQTIKFSAVALAQLVKTLVTQVIPAFIKTHAAMLKALGVIGLIAAGIIYLNSQWSNMGTIQKVIGILGGLTAAAFAAALALGAFHSAWSIGIAAAAIVAGIAAVVASVETARAGIKFAKGGIVYGETNAIVAEYQGAKTNPEVIAPLSDLNGIMVETLKKVVYEGNVQLNSTNQGNQSTNSPIIVNLEMDGKVLGKVVLPYINQGQKQTNIKIR